MDSEALVVGAGPTGLMMATELIRRGIDTRIVDRAARRNPHAKAIILQPRALEVMARLGLEDRIRDAALPVVAANYYTRGRRVARINFRGLKGSRFGTPLSLPQNETEGLLLDALHEAGGWVEYGHRLAALAQDADGVDADLLGTVHRTGRLLGCDGAHSAVREQLGVAFTGPTYPQSFVLVDGEWDTPLAHAEAHYFMGPTGVLVVVGLPGGLIRVFGSAPESAGPENVEETVQAIAAQRSPVPLELTSVTGAGHFRVHRKMADRFRDGRVLLAGDAAHVHSPAGGQGLNTSIQDAHEAAWRLAGVIRGRLPAAELAAWERERMHVAHAVVTDTDRQTRLWTWGGWRERARDLAASAAERSGVLDRVLPSRLAQMDLRYPAEGPALGSLGPGTRLPDIPLPSGGRTHDLLRDGRHALLVLAGRTPFPGRNVPACAHLDARTARALGARRPGAVLVRPDGVVAAAAALTDPAALRRLEQLLPAGHGCTGTGHHAPAPVSHEEKE
ncbi:FAD-dependent monooxygenase [Streptomyces yerevanensis]|uniref:FAD-dependent monooxygenase n=1 Tax=Streptomyces yerevanensis TaxID=66378 RepID=UPI00068AAC97|nr:FAD-dependent monooxygenase [Streptomyces yerevanensis]